MPKPSLQVGTCVILKHLVNSTSKEISDAGMKEHLISGVLKLLSVNDLEVRAAFAQLIVAMGKASLLTMGGGRELVLFLVKQCAIDRGEIDEWERNQKGWFSKKNASATSPAQLRAGCERFVGALVEIWHAGCAAHRAPGAYRYSVKRLQQGRRDFCALTTRTSAVR